MSQVHSVLAGGIPYLTFGYWSMPGFVYLLTAGFLVGGYFGAGAIVFLSDALTGVVIYKIARIHVKSDVTAMGAALVYLLLPLVLASEGYMWLDMQPMLLFMVLSFYYMYDNKFLVSGIFMGAAVLMKQEAIPVILVMMLFIWMTSPGWKQKLKEFSLGSFSLIGSGVAPFLILTPGNFLNSISFLSFFPSTPIQTGPQPIYHFVNATSLCSVIVNGAVTVTGPASCLANITSSTFIIQIEVLLNAIAIPIIIPLAVFGGVLSVVFTKKHIVRLEVTCGYIITTVLAFMTFHAMFGYYFIPVYAVLLASVRDTWDLVILAPMLVASTFFAPPALVLVIYITIIMLIVHGISLKTPVLE
jgi:hypothetical protein